ncbi:MAG: hypothetical protein ACRD82_19770, partial [Blastocatellia bacterium]
MTQMKRLAIAMLFAALITLAAAKTSNHSSADAAGGSNWAQWRGPDSQGISYEKNLPTEWSDTKNVLWKAALPGKGFSQPIIWGKRVFLTTDVEGGPAPESHKPPKH